MSLNGQCADNEHVNVERLFDFFRSKIEKMSPASQKNYRTALVSLQNFVQSDATPEEVMSTGMLSEWLLALSIKGLSLKTIRLYFDIVSALTSSANKEKLVSNAVFDSIRTGLSNMVKGSTDVTARHKRLTTMLASAQTMNEQDRMAADMVLLSLSSGCMPVAQVALLTKDDISERNADIAKRHAEARRKYIFPLGQSLKTPRQVTREAETIISSLLRRYNIGVAGVDVDITLRSLWAYAALCCGATGSMVLSCLGQVPADMPLFVLCEAAATSAAERNNLVDAVDRLLRHNPKRWFAMRLRRGVSPADIHSRLKTCNLEQLEIFYPCEEIARRVGRRLVVEQEPVLPQIAFFKSRLSDIMPLFARIGDLAWCFKSTPGAGAHYAPIPKAEMERFQQTIGHFTSEYEVAALGGLTLRPGDKVKVVGGIYAGRDGLIEGIDSGDPATIYRLLLTGESGIEWRARVDSRLLRQGC